MRFNKSLIAGVACGLCCAGCVALFVAHAHAEAQGARADALARYGGEQIEVIVASRTISAGETITDGMVETKVWLADLLPEGAVTKSSEVVGKQAGSSILEGEVVSTQRLARVDASLDIPEGMTAVSVPARDVSAVGGALRVGARTDVYAVGSTSTTLLARDVLVLATSLGEGGSLLDSSVSWVTLAVAPDSVQELVSAAQNLELYFTLPGETSVSEGDAATSTQGSESDGSAQGSAQADASAAGETQEAQEVPAESSEENGAHEEALS